LPSSRVQDIDNEEDWRRAEILYRILNDEKLGK
jgi:CMP-N-acetylneuraminic acid synthetase